MTKTANRVLQTTAAAISATAAQPLANGAGDPATPENLTTSPGPIEPAKMDPIHETYCDTLRLLKAAVSAAIRAGTALAAVGLWDRVGDGGEICWRRVASPTRCWTCP